MRPNRPHIPSFITFSKSTKTKQNRGANLLAFPEPPHLQIFRPSARLPFRVSASLRLRFRPSPSLFRFGEAVFTETRRNPQEEKMQVVTFFSLFLIFPQNLGVGVRLCTRGPHRTQYSCGREGRLRWRKAVICCFAASTTLVCMTEASGGRVIQQILTGQSMNPGFGAAGFGIIT